MIRWMLAVWSLVPLPFLKPAWTSGSSQFTYCWSLAWRILSMWDESNCVVLWAFFGIAFLWNWSENWPFLVLWPLLSFPNLLADILECEVKWTLKSITMNKTSGSDGIPVELFQILKDDAVKCCTQYASKFGKLSSGHRTRKVLFSFQSWGKAMPKNSQTTAQLNSSYTLAK